ncbi:MAG: hypothetical protein LBT24_01605 [Tannerella sp.]|nr:hypothetical protein [Tannerella sp.]
MQDCFASFLATPRDDGHGRHAGRPQGSPLPLKIMTRLCLWNEIFLVYTREREARLESLYLSSNKGKSANWSWSLSSSTGLKSDLKSGL